MLKSIYCGILLLLVMFFFKPPKFIIVVVAAAAAKTRCMPYCVHPRMQQGQMEERACLGWAQVLVPQERESLFLMPFVCTYYWYCVCTVLIPYRVHTCLVHSSFEGKKVADTSSMHLHICVLQLHV